MSKRIRTISLVLLMAALCWFGIRQWWRAERWEDAAVTGTSGAAQLLSGYGNYWGVHRFWPSPGEVIVPRWNFVVRLHGSRDEDVYSHASAYEPRLLLVITMLDDGKVSTEVTLGSGREFAAIAKPASQP